MKIIPKDPFSPQRSEDLLYLNLHKTGNDKEDHREINASEAGRVRRARGVLKLTPPDHYGISDGS